MKPEEIQQGHCYRFRGGLTVYLVLHVWPNSAPGNDSPPEAEVVILQHGHIASNFTKILPIAELAPMLTGEVRPQWIDMLDGGVGCKYDAGKPPKVPGQCKLRGWHSFRSQDPAEKCADCGITVLQAVEAQEAKIEAEAAAAATQAPAPDPRNPQTPGELFKGLQQDSPEAAPEVTAADFLKSLTGG